MPSRERCAPVNPPLLVGSRDRLAGLLETHCAFCHRSQMRTPSSRVEWHRYVHRENWWYVFPPECRLTHSTWSCLRRFRSHSGHRLSTRHIITFLLHDCAYSHLRVHWLVQRPDRVFQKSDFDENWPPDAISDESYQVSSPNCVKCKAANVSEEILSILFGPQLATPSVTPLFLPCPA